MSLLTATISDTEIQSKPLPEGKYTVTVEEARVEQKDNGTSFFRRYGNIRYNGGSTTLTLPNGTTFTIGNRKLFARSWIDHNNEKAAEIGQREIKKEAIAVGLMQKPTAEQSSDLDFPSWESYAEALIGRDVTVMVKHRTYEGKTTAEVQTYLLP